MGRQHSRQWALPPAMSCPVANSPGQETNTFQHSVLLTQRGGSQSSCVFSASRGGHPGHGWMPAPSSALGCSEGTEKGCQAMDPSAPCPPACCPPPGTWDFYQGFFLILLTLAWSSGARCHLSANRVFKVSQPGEYTLPPGVLWGCNGPGLARAALRAQLCQGAAGELGQQKTPSFHMIGLIFFFSRRKRIKLQDSFNIFTMLKLKLSSRLCV